MMPHVLKLPHLVQEYGMAEMQVGRGGIETRFDTQGAVLRQLLDQLRFYQ